MDNESIKSLSEEIDDAGTTDPKVIYEIRRRREARTGIPMEEDDLGIGETEIIEMMTHGFGNRIDESMDE